MRTRIVPIILAAATLGAVGCGSDGEQGSDADRPVVAAFYPLAFAAGRIAPSADVTNLTPAGAEPHDLELTVRDVERVRAARAVFYLGNGFVPALESAIDGNDHAVDLLVGLDLIEARAEDDHVDEDGGDAREEPLDPHVWLDPIRFAAMAERIAEALGDPSAATDLVAELTQLDAELRAGLETCERRTIVTSHAAFAYLADAYELEQVALTGLVPEVEPSAKAIEALVEEVEAHGATTVFFETLVSPALAKTVAREAGVTTAVLNPLEGLTDDEIDAGMDYFSVMRANLDALRTALGCS